MRTSGQRQHEAPASAPVNDSTQAVEPEIATDDAPPRYPFPFEQVDAEFERLREGEPVARVVMPSGDVVWLVTRFEDIRSVFAEPRLSRDLRVPGGPRMTAQGDYSDNPGAMVGLEGAAHQRRRRPVIEHLTAHRVTALRPSVEAIAHELAVRMAESEQPVDFMEAFAYPLPSLFMAKLLGVPDEDRELFRKHGWPLATPDQHQPDQIAESFAAISQYAANLIASKKENPADDLLSALIRAQADGLLADYEVEVSVYELMFAGFITTASVLCAGIIILTRHREYLDALSREGAPATSFAEEVLRLYPPADNALLRVATEDLEVGGVQIKAGEGVLVALAPANRDPRIYADGSSFDPKRFEDPSCPAHMSFGHGRHRCAGAALARLEVEVAMSVIARQFPTLRLAVPEEQLVWRYGLFERRVEKLPLAW